MTKIILLTGPAGAGKTTAGNILSTVHGFALLKFATPIKSMLYGLGLTEEHIEGSLKEVPCDLLGGRTPRYAMQTLGTEWGREIMHPAIWIEVMIGWIKRLQHESDLFTRDIVIDDTRFPNEITRIALEFIPQEGFEVEVWDIVPNFSDFKPSVGSEHSSERDLSFLANQTLHNHTREQLVHDIEELIYTGRVLPTANGQIKEVDLNGDAPSLLYDRVVARRSDPQRLAVPHRTAPSAGKSSKVAGSPRGVGSVSEEASS